MSDRVKNLSLEARKLPLAELIEDLLASLDAPDARIDALWAGGEAERRLELVDSGEMPTRDAAEAIAELRSRLCG
ncbi:MAG: addiction module protein [Rhodomicrobium sp.]